jgi:hypothetical protein
MVLGAGPAVALSMDLVSAQSSLLGAAVLPNPRYAWPIQDGGVPAGCL